MAGAVLPLAEAPGANRGGMQGVVACDGSHDQPPTETVTRGCDKGKQVVETLQPYAPLRQPWCATTVRRVPLLALWPHQKHQRRSRLCFRCPRDPSESVGEH